MSAPTPRKLKVFFSYSHKDASLRDRLGVALSMLKRDERIEVWFDGRILPGQTLDPAITTALDEADLILLLISDDFIASNYCYCTEMKRAIERHQQGQAHVVPIVLRPCDWTNAPFGKLKMLPTDAKPISTWANRDQAYTDVAKGVRRVVDHLAPVP